MPNQIARFQILLLCFCLGATPAFASWYCPKFLTRLFWGEPTPRELEQDQLAEAASLESQSDTLNGMTGRHLSATQYALRNISQIIDHYLLMGDVGPLVNLYQAKIRAAELNYLQRERNLTIMETLGEELTALAVKPEPMAAERAKYLEEWKNCGLLTDETSESLKTANGKTIVSWINGNLNRLRKENRAHEKMMGRNFEEWRQVRKHLNDLIDGKDEFLLSRVEQADNRAALASFEAPESTRAPQPGEQLKAALKAREAQVKERVKLLSASIAKVDVWIAKVQKRDAPLAVDELRAFLEEAKYLNDALRAALAKEVDADAANDRTSLLAELELLRARLVDASQLVTEAFKLSKVLGVQSGDFSSYAHLIPEYALRPDIEHFASVVYNSKIAQRARLRRERWRALWSFIDGNLLYGNVGKVIPTLGRGAAGIKAPFLRNFLYLLFKDLYLQHAESQYFPSLTLLRRAKGDAQKLRRMMESLNAGSGDELLVVFARRADMTGLWKLIRSDAERDKETDHHKLHERMLKAEATAFDLGPISLITGSSYARYIVAGVLNGTILYFASKWWIAPGVQSVWTSIFGAALEPTPGKSWMDKFTGWLVPLAHAGSSEPELIELAGFDEETDALILSDLETVVYGLTLQKGITPPVLEAAAQRLLDWEGKFSGKSVNQLVRLRCGKCLD